MATNIIFFRVRFSTPLLINFKFAELTSSRGANIAHADFAVLLILSLLTRSLRDVFAVRRRVKGLILARRLLRLGSK